MIKQNTKNTDSGLSLDLGSYSIKLAQFIAQGKEAGIKVAEQKIPAGLSGQERDSFIADAVKKLFLANRFKKAPLTAGLPQNECCIRRITIPQMPQAKIPEAVRWAAKKHIVHPEEEVVLSFSVTAESVEYETKKIDIVFIAVQKAAFQRYSALIQKTGLKAGGINTSCFGLGNALAFGGWPADKALAVLDIGFSGANLTFFKDNQLIFTRSIPAGGEDFDALLRQKLSAQVKSAEIEELKNRLGLASDEAKELVPGLDLSGYILASSEYLEKLLKELQLSFGHYRQISHGEEAEKVVLCGAGAQLKNLPEKLAQELSLAVEIIRPPAGASFPQAGSDFSAFAAAFGLALEAGKSPNLLLARQKQVKKSFFAGEKILKNSVISFAGLMLIWLTLLSGANVYSHIQLGASESKLRELSGKNTELLALARKIARLELRKEVFTKIRGSEPALTEILAAISRVVNPGREITVQSINFENSGGLEAKLVIRGEITGREGLSLSGLLDGFISGLEETGYFKKIVPNFRESADTEDGRKILIFDLDCRIDAKS